MSGEAMFADMYVVYVYAQASLSFFLNVILSTVIATSHNKNGQYFKYTTSFVTANFIYSTACVIVMPYWYQSPQLCAIFSASPISPPFLLQTLVFDVWWSSVLAVLLLAAISFVQRHAFVCNSPLRPFFESKWELGGMAAIPFISMLVWKSAYSGLSSEPGPLRSKLESELGSALDIDFRTAYLLAIRFKEIANSLPLIVAFMIFALCMSMIYLTTIYCAVTINGKIKEATFSANLKKKHMKALQILILQTLNPFIVIYVPFMIIFIASLLGVDWHFPEKIADVLIHFYPVSNAIIILTMTDEYKKLLLKRAGLSTRSVQSVAPSRVKDTVDV